MPLPAITKHGAQRCRAKAKHSGQRCNNPATHGMPVCRVHGARRPETIRRGAKHPAYLHGQETQEAQATRSMKLTELRDLEAAMIVLGLHEGARWPGRKPKLPLWKPEKLPPRGGIEGGFRNNEEERLGETVKKVAKATKAKI
jgi:hypothetical protein